MRWGMMAAALAVAFPAQAQEARAIVEKAFAAARVHSHIDGVKEAEFLYDDFAIGEPMADSLFTIAKGQVSGQ